MARHSIYRQPPDYESLTGRYDNISLDVVPQGSPSTTRWPGGLANYRFVLAYLHVYLDGSNATEHLSSAYMAVLLADLLTAIPILHAGGEARASGDDDPWFLVMHGYPDRNQVTLTLEYPGRGPMIWDVDVPLHRFAEEVVRIGHEWLAYLRRYFKDEIEDPYRNQQFLRLEQRLREAEEVARDT